MKALRNLVIAMVAFVLIVDLLTGQLGGLVVALVALLVMLTSNLHTVLVAVALPVLFIGALIYASPWHRDAGVRVMVGALVVLAIAELGPPFLHWFDQQLAAYGVRLFGSRS